MALASRIVRTSKFRHVFAEPNKPEQCFSDLELSPVTGDHNYIRCNSKFFSVSARGGGGPVLVMPFTATGKLPRGYPTINGHSGAVLDTAWSPFNDHLLATGSDDATVKLWAIPEGGLTENMKDPLVTLSGHAKPVSLLQWNPVADNVLASVAKEPSVRIWDAEKGTAGVVLSGFEGLVQDLAWNVNGSLLVTSDKSKSAKIFDVRSATVASEWKPHSGGKPFKVLPLGSTGHLVTVGFTAQAKREFKVWDVAAGFDKPLTTVDLDQSAGTMMPFYDEDTRMMYLTGKGDGNVRYYEFTDDAPFVHALSEYRSNVSTKGADMVPKRGLNVMGCEVARMLKLTSTTVEPISFIVPRKETCFQEDVFPDTYAGIASMSAEEWFAGNNVAGPKRISLDPAKNGNITASVRTEKTAAAKAPTPVVAPAASPSVSSPSAADTAALSAAQAAAKKAEARVAELEATVATLSAELVEVKAAAASGAPAAAGGSEEAEALRAEVEALRARVAELEASEAKLKKAVAAFTA